MVYGRCLLDAKGTRKEVARQVDLRVREWRAAQRDVEGVASEGVDE